MGSADTYVTKTMGYQNLKQNLTAGAEQQQPVQPATHTGNSMTLRDCVDRALKNYFSHLDGQSVTDVYNMVLAEVEAPLLERTMQYMRGNQTQAAILLGLNRGTLRKKLKQYDLL